MPTRMLMVVSSGVGANLNPRSRGLRGFRNAGRGAPADGTYGEVTTRTDADRRAARRAAAWVQRRRSQRFWFLSMSFDTVATHIDRQGQCLLTPLSDVSGLWVHDLVAEADRYLAQCCTEIRHDRAAAPDEVQSGTGTGGHQLACLHAIASARHLVGEPGQRVGRMAEHQGTGPLAFQLAVDRQGDGVSGEIEAAPCLEGGTDHDAAIEGIVGSDLLDAARPPFGQARVADLDEWHDGVDCGAHLLPLTGRGPRRQGAAEAAGEIRPDADDEERGSRAGGRW